MRILLDEIETSEPQDGREVLSRLFAVYDEQTGSVVHVHRCTGDAEFVADEAHARMALEMATGAGLNLRVLTVPPELDLRGEVEIGVDIGSGQLRVVKVEPLGVVEFASRRDRSNPRGSKAPRKRS